MDQLPPDEVLLRDFVRGDNRALGELAERYETLLLGLARGMLAGRDDLARDAVQDTWSRVVRYGSGFNGRATFRTWIYRIALNRCRDIRKRELRAGKQQDAEINDVERTSVQAGDRDERVDELQRAVEQLSSAQRELLLLCYHRGLTHEQAATVLQIPIGTLKSRLSTTLRELREWMSVETAR